MIVRTAAPIEIAFLVIAILAILFEGSTLIDILRDHRSVPQDETVKSRTLRQVALGNLVSELLRLTKHVIFLVGAIAAVLLEPPPGIMVPQALILRWVCILVQLFMLATTAWHRWNRGRVRDIASEGDF